jgi:uncharacterized membrane protein
LIRLPPEIAAQQAFEGVRDQEEATMETTDVLQAIFRWMHVVAGILWIGLLYFFNFVNGPFAATMDGGTKQKVVPELMPRALYWFRWGAAWTWITGVLLLLLVFYHGKVVFEAGQGWSLGAIVMIAVTFLAFLAYDALFKSPLGKDLRTAAAIGLVIVAVIVWCYSAVGGFGYRGYVIHTGALFGTIMAANVWMRIWPSQRKIITATKQGQPPDAAVVALAGARSRHNTYLSVPLVWTMIDSHTTAFAGLAPLLVAILLGWGTVYWLYTKAGTVKGF